MRKPKANGRNLGQEARIVMHEDEHVIIKAMLLNALGDDNCLGRPAARDRSESTGAEERLLLARFLVRMERQFELRAEARAAAKSPDQVGRSSSAPAATPANRVISMKK